MFSVYARSFSTLTLRSSSEERGGSLDALDPNRVRLGKQVTLDHSMSDSIDVATADFLVIPELSIQRGSHCNTRAYRE